MITRIVPSRFVDAQTFVARTFVARALVAVAIVFLAGCTADQLTNVITDDANSMVVNGSGYTETKFKGFSADTASSAAELEGGVALVVFSGLTSKSTETFGLTLMTKSVTPGSYQISATEGTTMTLVTSSGSTPVTYTATTGSITIQSWSAAGGQATGTFFGSFVLPSDPTNTVLQVTAGTFSVKRR